MSGLKDKVALITGASGGIGCATAVEFARAGSKVSLTGRNEEKLKATEKLCIEAGLSEEKILIVLADVTKQEDILKIIEKTIEKFKQIDVLVNNAGSVSTGGFENLDLDVFDEMLNTNTKSVFRVSRAALPHLLQSKGSIVNVSSIAGTRPLPYCFAYSTAKAAVNHMTQMMALELAPKGVRVNSVNPGVIMTDIFIKPGAHMSHAPENIDKFYASMASAHPMQRVGRPEEVAKTILFLASDASPFMSGAIVPIDGARHATCSVPSIQMAS